MNGKITFDATLNKFINDNGDVDTTGFTFVSVTFTGFKVLKATNITRGNINLPDQSNNLSSSYTDEMIKSYIFNNLIIGDKPEGFTKENILLFSVIRADGKITFNASLNKFIDDNGVVQENDKFIPVNITFTGFKVSKPTNITSDDRNLSGQSNNLSSTYTDEMIKQYIYI